MARPGSLKELFDELPAVGRGWAVQVFSERRRAGRVVTFVTPKRLVITPVVPAHFPKERVRLGHQAEEKQPDGKGQHRRQDGERIPGHYQRHARDQQHHDQGAAHYMYYYSNAYALNQYFAHQGYVVLSVNYRSGIGYGLDFREAINYGARGASEFNDVMGAGLYLKARPDVDPKRIGVWGGSYGGYLTALALSRASDLFAAGVDLHGVHDWSTLRDYFGATLGGNPAEQNEQREAARIAFDSSPIASVNTWRSPVLLIHGDDDRNVSFSQTVVLADALRQRHVEFEELIFPNEIHDFLMQQHWVRAYKAAADFFARKLRGNTEAVQVQ
jgi:fermentation-respiration switch protein FrsA (DUF1100 family)